MSSRYESVSLTSSLVPLENKCRILRSHPAALSFIRRCLTLSPTERTSTSELLSASDYLHDGDFIREKGDLLDRIRRQNLPHAKTVPKGSKSSSDYKYSMSHVSSSTSKLHHMKNYRQNENDKSKNGFLKNYDYGGDSNSHSSSTAKKNEMKSMPDITAVQGHYSKGTIQMSNRQKQNKHKSKPTKQTKLPKL